MLGSLTPADRSLRLHLPGTATTCRAYAVLNRRRARVLREDMNEGTGSFTVASHLPVAESFGLAQELRAHTAGAAAAQLMISHWERLEVDPSFVPTTEDEREEFGTVGGGGTPCTPTVHPGVPRVDTDTLRVQLRGARPQD